MGFDARAVLAELGPNGHVTAVDVSEVMLAEARSRHADADTRLKFQRQDVESLSFADETFDRVRADRVVRHLDQARSLAELFRVTRRGGRIVVSEPDWQSVMIETDTPQLDRRLESAAAQGDDSPRSGRNLASALEVAGFVDVAIRTYVLVSRSLYEVDAVYGLRTGVADSEPGDGWTQVELETWVRGADTAAAHGRFVFALPCFVVTGIRPAPADA